LVCEMNVDLGLCGWQARLGLVVGRGW
jgi:hypothetical protein